MIEIARSEASKAATIEPNGAKRPSIGAIDWRIGPCLADAQGGAFPFLTPPWKAPPSTKARHLGDKAQARSRPFNRGALSRHNTLSRAGMYPSSRNVTDICMSLPSQYLCLAILVSIDEVHSLDIDAQPQPPSCSDARHELGAPTST